MSRDEEELERVKAQLRSLSVSLPALIEHVRGLAEAHGHTLASPLPDADKARQRLASFAAYLDHFGRIDARTLGPIDVREVLEEAVALTRGEIELKGRVAASYRPAPLVRASPRQLGHVFVALLINAAHALPAGAEPESGPAGSVTRGGAPDNQHVVVELGTSEAGWARVTVADTGSGISEDVLPHIFKPLYSTKRGAGVGVGLAIVREIVQGLGGRISVGSVGGGGTGGGGTLFIIELPPAS